MPRFFRIKIPQLFLFAIVLVLVGAGRIAAQDITVEATVDATSIELGSLAQLTLTVTGVQNLPPISLPDIDGFKTRYLGPSTRISIANGNYSASVAFLYALYPERTGKFTIPGFKATVNGQEYTTKPFEVEVVGAGAAPSSSSQANGNSQPSSESLTDRVFLSLDTPKTQVYLNDKVPVKIRLYMAGISVRNITMPEFEHKGFIVDDFEKPRQLSQTYKGVAYQMIEFTTAVYPTRSGELTLGPARQNCEIAVRSRSRRSAPGGFGGLFEDEFFDNFFGNVESRSMALESKPVTLQVLPFPETGKPADFSDAIGSFNFEVTVAPQELKVGDPITVRLRVFGDGNVKSLSLPGLEKIPGSSENFKLYDPQVSEKDDGKILEQVLIPKNDKVKEIPAVSFSFFDPQAGQYQTIRRGPFPIKVSPSTESAVARIVGPTPNAERAEAIPEQLGQDIVFIKNWPGPWQRRRSSQEPGYLFLVVLGVVLLAWASIFAHYRLTHKIRTDERFARRLRAPRQAKRGLATLRQHLLKGEQKEFYDQVFKIVQDYFGGKFHLPAGAVTVEAIPRQINQRLRDDLLTKLNDIIKECEAVRYASYAIDKEKMKSCYANLQEIIDYFERI